MMSAGDRRLPDRLHELMHGIAGLLHVTSFEVFGGAARDMLADPHRPGLDIDVAIRGGAADAHACHARLSACGPPTPVRPYWVHLTRPVSTFDVPWKDRILDISFMDHTPQAHFDVETVIWRFPELTYSDPHQVTRRSITGVRLVTSLDADNPVLLLNRILKLSAKYRIDMAADPYLRAVVGELVARAACWAPDDVFHGHYAHDAHLRHLHGAVRRTRDGEAFILSCVRAGILDARLRPLADTLRRRPAMVPVLAQQALRRDLTGFWEFTDAIVAAGPGWRDYRPGSSHCNGH
jgi:hypothetical protein